MNFSPKPEHFDYPSVIEEGVDVSTSFHFEDLPFTGKPSNIIMLGDDINNNFETLSEIEIGEKRSRPLDLASVLKEDMMEDILSLSEKNKRARLI